MVDNARRVVGILGKAIKNGYVAYRELCLEIRAKKSLKAVVEEIPQVTQATFSQNLSIL